MVRSILFASIVFIGAASPVSAGLVLNGSFEDPVSPGSYFTVAAGSSSLTSWTVGTVAGTGVDIVKDVLLGAAYDGHQYIDLDGTPGPGSVSQSFTTTVGESYTLTFAYANNFHNASTASAAYSVFDGLGNILGPTTITHNTSGGSGLDWTVLSVNFAARETTTSVLFKSLSALGINGGILLDAVSVDPAASTAVPEPSSILIVGFGALLCLAARRRNRAAA